MPVGMVKVWMFDMYSYEHGKDTKWRHALDARGVTPNQQQTKMQNLAALGPVVIKAIRHDCYEVQGKEGLYNPYTDTWITMGERKWHN